MEEKIYYSRIEFVEMMRFGIVNFRLILDLVNKEIIYQEYGIKRNNPHAKGLTTVTYYFDKETYTREEEEGFPLRNIKSGKTNFKSNIVRDEYLEPVVTYVKGIQLSDEDMAELLPYCNALDFEPFRNREVSMSDAGFIGYRDEVKMYFSAITDSYIPKIDLPMSYYYDDAHIWPSEKLYRHLVFTYFRPTKSEKTKKKKVKQEQRLAISAYGSCSLFGV